MIHEGSQVRHTHGAVGEVIKLCIVPEEPRLELKPGYARVMVKVIKAQGPYKVNDWVIWDVKDH